MYQEEKQKIEERIDALIKDYMEYERKTYIEFKSEYAVSLVSMFPELKSDSLLQEQIKVYIANNEKLKELKEEKINLKTCKFELYFGK